MTDGHTGEVTGSKIGQLNGHSVVRSAVNNSDTGFSIHDGRPGGHHNTSPAIGSVSAHSNGPSDGGSSSNADRVSLSSDTT